MARPRRPAFTLRTYVHLMDEGIGDAAFLDAVDRAEPGRVNTRSTGLTETAANEKATNPAQGP